MGFFSKTGSCSNCGTDGAIKSLFKTRCPNPSCTYFDQTLLSGVTSKPSTMSPVSNFATPPAAGTVRLEYTNFQGVSRTFDVNPKTALKKGQHISVCLAGQKKRISLAVKRIKNPSALA